MYTNEDTDEMLSNQTDSELTYVNSMNLASYVVWHLEEHHRTIYLILFLLFLCLILLDRIERSESPEVVGIFGPSPEIQGPVDELAFAEEAIPTPKSCSNLDKDMKTQIPSVDAITSQCN
ncbi:hypothetical protein O3G_MSEX002189 [Manduca sexta]|uniref:Uncharacterized protein n=1 Tax=Manduca sexta TaxID=7130 RepID=A0A921YN30_MANSE|nr:hypothetical protein O3G_MSEX002189 [Manduca sexta]